MPIGAYPFANVHPRTTEPLRQSRNAATCRAQGPGDVQVEVVGGVDGHVEVLVGLRGHTGETHGRIRGNGFHPKRLEE